MRGEPEKRQFLVPGVFIALAKSFVRFAGRLLVVPAEAGTRGRPLDSCFHRNDGGLEVITRKQEMVGRSIEREPVSDTFLDKRYT